MKPLKTRLRFLGKLLLVCLATCLVLLAVQVQQDASQILPLSLSGMPRGEQVSAEQLRGSLTFQWPGSQQEERGDGDSVPMSTPSPAPTRHPLQVVYPYSYRFLLNEPDKCRAGAPFLVLLVVTEPQDIAARNAIRQTWGNESAVPGVSLLRLFLSGVHPRYGSPLQQLLEEESALHHDIIQQDFLDTYNNLTLKTLMGLEWVSRHCPNASYVMKVDNDIFLNVGYLVRELLQPQQPPKQDYMTGYVYRGTGPLRSQAYKWYVPREVYPNNTYPPYCGGPGYVLSGDLARKVYGVAQTLRVINMEDAFIGICLYELGVHVTNSPWGLFNIARLEYERCRFAQLVLVHHYGPQDLLRVWPDFQGGNKTCPS